MTIISKEKAVEFIKEIDTAIGATLITGAMIDGMNDEELFDASRRTIGADLSARIFAILELMPEDLYNDIMK